MRIIGQLVVRNEASRYLDAVLSWHTRIFDVCHVYDDRSTDETVELALLHGCQVTRRPEGIPTFAAHEGKFREGAWRAMEETLHPAEGDWVFAVDADEFLVSDRDERGLLDELCDGDRPVLFDVPEVFKVNEGDDGSLTDPYVRLDGFWGGISQLRLTPYHLDGRWPDRAMGCGSLPDYATDPVQCVDANLMHYGYALVDDLQAKYSRYVAVDGHNSAHIRSIPAQPTLARWAGPQISVWRGRRSAVGLTVR